MSYTILKTDGTTLTQLVDGTIDQTTTDLTLIAKNATGYGVFFNDNFVHLLENFANTSQPNYPITGQLWFDTNDNRLKIYDGIQFKITGGTTVSPSAPSSLTTGDIWLDSFRQQMYFNDGNSTKLAGPIYTDAQGQTGFIVEDIVDTNKVSHTICFMYVARTLIGIFSKDSFTPLEAIAGFKGAITSGFNVGSNPGITFNVPVSSATALIASDGSLLFASNFVTTVGDSSTTGSITIQNSTPLVLGPASSTEINVNYQLFEIKSNSTNQNFSLNMLNSSSQTSALYVNASGQYVGIYTTTPTATLDVNGNARIRGNLTIEGSTTTINSAIINVSDKTIILAKTDSPSNTSANGGGLQIAAGTDVDKTFLWYSSSTAWTSSENLSLASGKTYKINGVDVITANSLGTAITSAPGLTSIGTQTTFQAGYVYLSGSTISYVNASVSNANLTLAPKGTGSVDISSAKLTSVATPTASTDGANKGYVDNSIQSAPLAISLTTTGFTNLQIASGILPKIFPANEHQYGTIIRAVCIDTGSTQSIAAGSFVTGALYTIAVPGSTNFTGIGAGNNNVGTVFIATGPGAGSGSANPYIRQFQLLLGTWTYQSYS